MGIRLQPGGQELKRIPAVRLRRRYPAKMAVRIYKGPDLGWRRMVIHPMAGKEGNEVSGLRIAEATPQLQSKSTPSEPWTLLPVCGEKDLPEEEESGSEEEFDPTKVPEPEWYPSYLVRANMLRVPESPSYSETGSPRTPSGASGGWCSADDKRKKKSGGGLCTNDGDADACSPTSPTSSLSPLAVCSDGKAKPKQEASSTSSWLGCAPETREEKKRRAP